MGNDGVDIDVDGGGRPEVVIAPVPTTTATTASETVSVVRPKLTLPGHNVESDASAMSLVRHGVVDQGNPALVALDWEHYEVSCHPTDPRLGYFTAYYWRKQPGMSRPPRTNFPIPQFARKVGVNFAVEPEPDPEP